MAYRGVAHPPLGCRLIPPDGRGCPCRDSGRFLPRSVTAPPYLFSCRTVSANLHLHSCKLASAQVQTCIRAGTNLHPRRYKLVSAQVRTCIRAGTDLHPRRYKTCSYRGMDSLLSIRLPAKTGLTHYIYTCARGQPRRRRAAALRLPASTSSAIRREPRTNAAVAPEAPACSPLPPRLHQQQILKKVGRTCFSSYLCDCLPGRGGGDAAHEEPPRTCRTWGGQNRERPPEAPAGPILSSRGSGLHLPRNRLAEAQEIVIG